MAPSSVTVIPYLGKGQKSKVRAASVVLVPLLVDLPMVVSLAVGDKALADARMVAQEELHKTARP